MSRVARKHVFGVFDQVLRELGCTVTEDGKGLELSNSESRGIVLYLCRENTALISCAVAVRLCFRINAKKNKNKKKHVFLMTGLTIRWRKEMQTGRRFAFYLQWRSVN